MVRLGVELAGVIGVGVGGEGEGEVPGEVGGSGVAVPSSPSEGAAAGAAAGGFFLEGVRVLERRRWGGRGEGGWGRGRCGKLGWRVEGRGRFGEWPAGVN